MQTLNTCSTTIAIVIAANDAGDKAIATNGKTAATVGQTTATNSKTIATVIATIDNCVAANANYSSIIATKKRNSTAISFQSL